MSLAEQDTVDSMPNIAKSYCVTSGVNRIVLEQNVKTFDAPSKNSKSVLENITVIL